MRPLRPGAVAVVALTAFLACTGSSHPPASSDPVPVSPDGGSGTPVDAAAGGGHASGTWCASQGPHDLCDDFDSPSYDPWVTAGSGSPGRPAGAGLTTTTTTSSPSALSSEVTATSVGTASARIQASVAAKGTDSSAITLSFDVYPVVVGPSPRLEIASVSGFNIVDLRTYGVALVLKGTAAAPSIEIDEGDDGVTTHPLAAPLPARQWTRVTLELTVTRGTAKASPPSTVAARLGGAAAETFTMQHHMPLNPFFTIGVSAVAPNEASTFVYDDVTYDLR